MWWRELAGLEARLIDRAAKQAGEATNSAFVSDTATLDTASGPIILGDRTRICAGAVIQGPVVIGADCLIGNSCLIRGPASLGDGTRVGFGTEIKNAIIEEGVTIGPQCFVADSKIERDAYLGAQVRTSNHRLDKQTVKVLVEDEFTDTGHEKLGCLIGAGSAVGIQVIVLPGRVIPPNSLIGPRITVERNLRPGRYRLAQQIETY